MHRVPLETAQIRWYKGVPYSEAFGDVYFSTLDGLQETSAVFLTGNGLPQRWQGKPSFTVAETGFGTGLNFLATLALWCETAPPSARLHFLSVEKFPLLKSDIRQAIGTWRTLNPYLEELLAVYPDPVAGFHRRHLLNGRVSLTLMLGDALASLAQLDAQVDAWFLDGFAPRKNEELWTETMFAEITRLSANEATFSTFTAAGHVKRGLEYAGFRVEKVPGFGGKRDRLQGRLMRRSKRFDANPWFMPVKCRDVSMKHAIVIGAGIAGASAAHALARRGWRVTVIERHARVATEASGNPAGVVMPRLTADMNEYAQFYTSAFAFTVYWLNEFKRRHEGLEWYPTGVLQLLPEERIKRLTELQLPPTVLRPVTAPQAGALCGTEVRSGGVFFPQAGWVVPAKLCQFLLEDEPSIELVLGEEVTRLGRNHAQWQVFSSAGCLGQAPVVVIASGSETPSLAASPFLTVQSVRGQLTYLKTNATRRRLVMPVCYEGYVTPSLDGQLCVGATYDAVELSRDVRSRDHQSNLAALGCNLPNFIEESDDAYRGRVAFRATTPDYWPIVGAIAEEVFYREQYWDLKDGKPARGYLPARYLPGLFITTGHGSRGLVSCPLAAELIADMANVEPLCMPRTLLDHLHPARFLVRQLRRERTG